MHKHLKTRLIAFTQGLLLFLSPAPAPSQSRTKSGKPPWQESLATEAKGTQIKIPILLLRELKLDQADCPDISSGATTKMDAYRIRRIRSVLVAVHGRGFCFCGATGNCALWVYRRRQGKYQQILSTDMVQNFGFLRTRTNGLPDLVLWSHDSATRSPGALWQFDGEQYRSICAWEVVYERLSPEGDWTPEDKPHIEDNTCKQFGPPSIPVSALVVNREILLPSMRRLWIGDEHHEIVAEDDALQFRVDLAVLRKTVAKRTQIVKRPGILDLRVE
jgi:hypothetical protein